MFADRWNYSFALEAMTPFHVGDGGVAIMPKADLETAPGYQTIVRDFDGQPYLPSATLKGCLKQIAREIADLDKAALDALFGEVKDEDKSKDNEDDDKKKKRGRMGLLLLRGGSVIASSAAPVDALPYGEALVLRNAFVAARTSIDPHSGTAADHKLFMQEMAPKGLQFAVRATLMDRGPNAGRAHAAWLRVIAAILRDGMFLGKARADGQGQFAVKGGSVGEIRQVLTAGVLKSDPPRRIAETAGRDERSERHSFALECRTPFLVVDSSRKGAGKETAKKDGAAQVFAQRVSKNEPLLLGSSIAGVLRNRAQWLQSLAELRGEAEAAEAGGIDPVDWLFGTSDQQARVALRNVKLSRASLEAVTSLKVDRFSSAPVHGALFTTEAFSGTRLAFDLKLVRRGEEPANPAAERLLAALVADIGSNGLRLGHGANKGFGWFLPGKEANRAA